MVGVVVILGVVGEVDVVQHHAGDAATNTVDEIQALIRSAIAVIVDLSESRANVLYEAGYSHALEKPTVHICSTPLCELPFDVAHWNTIKYQMGQTYHLRDVLARRLEAITL